MTSEELKEKRRKILEEVLGQNTMLVELKEIRDLLKSMNYKELRYIPDEGLKEQIKRLASILEKMPAIPDKIEVPKVNIVIPPKTKIDWENAPKNEIKWLDVYSGFAQIMVKSFNFKSHIDWISKQTETFFTPFLTKIISLINEPDKIEYSDTQISEWYGDRKITYAITRDESNKIIKVVRTEK